MTDFLSRSQPTWLTHLNQPPPNAGLGRHRHLRNWSGRTTHTQQRIDYIIYCKFTLISRTFNSLCEAERNKDDIVAYGFVQWLVLWVPLIQHWFTYKITLAKSLNGLDVERNKKQYWFVFSLQPVNLLKPKVYSLLFLASNLNIPRGIWVRLVEPHDMQSSLKYPDWKCIRLNRVATTIFFHCKHHYVVRATFDAQQLYNTPF